MFSPSSPRQAARSQRRSGRPAIGLAAAAALLAAGCDRAETRHVQADAHDAAAQTAAGLQRATVGARNAVSDMAADAKPAVDRAVHDAKRGVDDLAVATGKATVKAGATLERSGERHRQGGDTPRDGSD